MKGRTWCIRFTDSAKNDGNVSVKWKVITGGVEQELNGTWQGYFTDMTARQKADRFENKLLNDPNMSRLVGVARAGNTVCFQLKDDARYDDIGGVEIGDETGQTFHVFDDAPSSGLVVTRFRLAGQASNQSSVVRLGLGHAGKMAEIASHSNGEPLDLLSILRSLADAFNNLYNEVGFEATVEGDEVIIPEVPCEDGLVGGTNDEGLDSYIAIADAGLVPFRRSFDKIGILQQYIEDLYADISRLKLLQPLSPYFVREDVQAGTRACTGFVREVRFPDGTVRRSLHCEGECERGECGEQRSEDHHGGVRRWCGCPGEAEPTGCHVVIDRNAQGQESVLCAGGLDCAVGLDCLYTETYRGRIQDKNGAEVWYIRCNCG